MHKLDHFRGFSADFGQLLAYLFVLLNELVVLLPVVALVEDVVEAVLVLVEKIRE